MSQIETVENYINRHGRCHIHDVAEALELTYAQARCCLNRLASYDKIRRVELGVYTSMASHPEMLANRFLTTKAGRSLNN